MNDSRTGEDPPTQFCDVIMKGGITSGMVYPHAILHLQNQYRFKNIGGSSAGAIAAALAAAAEFNRLGGGFNRLKKSTDEISKSLLSLFQPEPVFRPWFQIFLHFIVPGSVARKVFKSLGTLISAYSAEIFAGVAPGLALGCYAFFSHRGWEAWAMAGLLLVAGPMIALVVRLGKVLFEDLPDNRYGICPGLKTERGKGDGLTTWLADHLDEIAGIKGRTAPLTFGDLHGQDPNLKDINLQIMTTNLTSGEPHKIPLRKRIYMFRVGEFEKLFPPRIVQHMVSKSHRYPDAGKDYYFLPRTADLPVVVAVRLSLSFPVLLQAVPLYARDFTFKDENKRKIPQKSWFSDGGITSNFPIHFFDGVWPRWPTFGITLGKFDQERHTSDVWMPSTAFGGSLSEFKPIGSLPNFLWSIFTAAQNWQDNMQSVQSGFRERIVRIALQEDEGGLHLKMDEEKIAELFKKGARAGKCIDDFDFQAHRWTRYLVSMDQFSELFGATHRAYVDEEGDRRPLSEFLSSYNPKSKRYKQSREWAPAALASTSGLMVVASKWDENKVLAKGKYPKPPSKLRGRLEL